MYQGKYQAPKGAQKPKRAAATRRIEDVPVRLAEDLQASPATQKPSKATFVSSTPVVSATTGAKAAPGQARPGIDAAKAPQQRTPAQKAPSQKPPAQNASAQKPREASAATAPKEKKKLTGGTIAFYAIYFLAIATFFMVVAGALTALDTWLQEYENSQPKYQCQQVFDQYFANPDWGALYDLAGIQDTEFEGKEEYVQHMTQLVGSQPIRYVATASGDPNRVCKYILKAGDLNLGTFTLVTGEHSEYEITQWDLGEVTLISPKREQAVTVTVGSGHTVYVNGIALNKEDIIRTTLTLAEELLPEGLHGHSSTTYYMDGLLVAPTVEVKDASGAVVQTTFDAAQNHYTAVFDKASFTIGENEKETVIAAAKILSEFRIEAKNSTALARHFDSNSAYYKATVKQDTWMQDYKSYSFSDPVVTEYYRYSDQLFSAHIEMKIFVTRKNDTIKEWDASGTFFFTKRSDGNWLVTDCVKYKVQQEVTKVRLQYMLDGNVVTYELVDSTSVQLEPPYVSVPEGKVFAGWFYEATDEQGKPVLALAFKPDETTGLVFLGTGVKLEPMVLHARFEDRGAE